MEIDLTPYRNARHGDLAEQVEFTLPAGATPLGGDVRLAEPVPVAVRVEGGPGGVLVAVSAHLHLEHPCDRCLETVHLDVPVAYTEEWRLAGGRRGRPDEGVEVVSENLDADDALVVRRTVTQDVGSLDDGFWQNVALEIPAKVLCTEECRGLCPRCGANRNRTPCACREADGDPRLDVLAQFRVTPKQK